MDINKIEHQVMDAMFFGDHPTLAILRKQYAVASVSERKQDDAGFVTHFVLPCDVEGIPGAPTFAIDDLFGDIAGLDCGVMFVLFIRKGCIDCLECAPLSDADHYSGDLLLKRLYYAFSYDNKFPFNLKISRFFMQKPVPIEKQKRDWRKLNQLLADQPS